MSNEVIEKIKANLNDVQVRITSLMNKLAAMNQAFHQGKEEHLKLCGEMKSYQDMLSLFDKPADVLPQPEEPVECVENENGEANVENAE